MKAVRYMACAAAAAVMFSISCNADAAQINVPKDVFEWVQSSARTNFFFNKQQIKFGVDSDGYIDQNVIIAPVLYTYDDVMVQDVSQKRRWRGDSMSGYDRLSGAAEYLSIDVKQRKVTILEHDDIADTMTTIGKRTGAREISIDKLGEHHLLKNFFDTIITYAVKHKDELISRTNGKVKETVTEKQSTDKTKKNHHSRHKH